MSQPKSNQEIANEVAEWKGGRLALAAYIKEVLAQKDAEVLEREKYVPRFKGVNIFSGEEVEGAGCYTSEKGTAYILEDNRGEEPTFMPVKEIKYDWYTTKE